MWIYAGVIVLVATQTVASNLTYEDLESIAVKTIQFPALYSCTSDRVMCIWQPGHDYPQAVGNHLENENGRNWTLFVMDGEYPALTSVEKAKNRSLIYCSSFIVGDSVVCSANNTEVIHSLTKVIVEDGDRVIVKNITMALHNESLEIVDNVTMALHQESAKIVDNITMALHQESVKTVDNITMALYLESVKTVDNITMALHQESVQTVDNVTTALQNESVQIMENITMALHQESAKTVDNIQALHNESVQIMENIQALVNTVREQNNSYNEIIGETHALAEKCESASTNRIILIVVGIHILLTLPLQVKSIVDLLKHLFKCRSRKREDNP